MRERRTWAEAMSEARERRICQPYTRAKLVAGAGAHGPSLRLKPTARGRGRKAQAEGVGEGDERMLRAEDNAGHARRLKRRK